MFSLLKSSLKNLRKSLTLNQFVLVMGGLNFILFHYPFFVFVFDNIDYTNFNGILAISSLMILMIIANAFTFYLFFGISRRISKILLSTIFIINSLSVYFINTYGVIIDQGMVSNVLNTNYEEASNFFSFKLTLYLVFLGILPSIFIFKIDIVKVKIKRYLITLSLTLLFIISVVFINSNNWLWIDKHSKELGGLAMPWSYTVNGSLLYINRQKQNEKEIPLPDAQIKNQEKSVVVLVIGESARSQNFSLYGYRKNTNPLLSKTENLFHFNAQSCATYTTAGVKCILEHKNTDKLYEILPNYLHRNGVEVIWRTTNSGEPPIHIEKYQNGDIFRRDCQGNDCNYDGAILTGLKEQILSSTKNKILVILHLSTSHGPNYNKKYPKKFEIFKPVCTSVELAECTQEELINAYDNTIVYTDYILHNVIENLKSLKDYQKTMLFVSDHGESLGEKNLYMHGLPMSIAPKEQFEIPFIVWTDDSKQLKLLQNLSQNHIFHSVMNFLSIESPIYDEKMNIYK